MRNRLRITITAALTALAMLAGVSVLPWRDVGQIWSQAPTTAAPVVRTVQSAPRRLAGNAPSPASVAQLEIAPLWLAAGLAVVAALCLLVAVVATDPARRTIGGRPMRRGSTAPGPLATRQNLQHALRRRDREAEVLARSQHAARQASVSQAVLLAQVTHDTRNLMQGILGLIGLLTQGRESENRDCLASLQATVGNLLDLLDNALATARAEADTAANDIVDINALLSDLQATFAPRAYARGLEFHAASLEPCQLHVRTAGSQLRQALTNLIGNAVKFTRQGHVAIRAQLGAAAGNRCWVRIIVQDTGPGIPAVVHRALFEPFFQHTEDARSLAPGVGLGLYTVKQIVDRLQGRIQLLSTPGKGSQFTLSLPLVIERHDTRAAGLPLLSAVLLEKYRPLSRCRRRFLAQAGLQLVDEPCGPSGVVLVDVAAAQLCNEQAPPPCPSPPGRWPLVAYVSSYDPQRLEQLQQCGYGGVLVKTGCPRRFRTALDALLRRCRKHTPNDATTGCRTHDRVRHHRMLIVDDDAINRQVFRAYCAELGLGVDCASSTQEALQLMHTTRYAVIFTDLHMPDSGGEELARAIRCGPQRRAKIVALTAAPCPSFARLRARGIDALLRKPVSRQQFHGCIGRRVLARRSHRRIDASTAALRSALRQRLPHERTTLASLVASASYAKLAFAAHRLHGAAVYCDAPELARALRQLERAACDADTDLITHAFAAADLAIDRFATNDAFSRTHRLGI